MTDETKAKQKSFFVGYNVAKKKYTMGRRNDKPITTMTLLEQIHNLEAQIEKMKCCEICEYGMNVCKFCYSPELCKNKDKWKLHHRLSEIEEYSK